MDHSLSNRTGGKRNGGSIIGRSIDIEAEAFLTVRPILIFLPKSDLLSERSFPSVYLLNLGSALPPSTIVKGEVTSPYKISLYFDVI